MTLAQYIRSQFPNPIGSYDEAWPIPAPAYGVAGAVLMYKRRLRPEQADSCERFPPVQELYNVFRAYHPYSPRELLMEWASDVLWFNDLREYESAWAAVERALAGCVDHP